MDKFKMELTWHNCKTCPPEEVFNPWLIYTDGNNVSSLVYYKKYGFPASESELHKYWWADISRTVRESNVFNSTEEQA